MNLPVLLLVLRLVSAVLLLAFMGAIAWLIYKDIQVTSSMLLAEQRLQGELIIVESTFDPSQTGARHKLNPQTTIGRSPKNTLVLDDDFVSNDHVLITLQGTRWWLEDLGSRNGTLLNGFPIETPTVVTSGDVITVGRTDLKFEL